MQDSFFPLVFKLLGIEEFKKYFGIIFFKIPKCGLIFYLSHVLCCFLEFYPERL
jgi:hypothetical protein